MKFSTMKCITYLSLSHCNSDPGSADDSREGWKQHFFAVVYACGLLKEPSPVTSSSSRSREQEETEGGEGGTRSLSLYRRVASWMGISVEKSDYEQYALVQNCTDSLSGDTDTDGHGDGDGDIEMDSRHIISSVNHSSNEMSELESLSSPSSKSMSST